MAVLENVDAVTKVVSLETDGTATPALESGDNMVAGSGCEDSEEVSAEEIVSQKKSTQHRRSEFTFFRRLGNLGGGISAKETMPKQSSVGHTDSNGQMLPTTTQQKSRPRFPIEDDEEEFEFETQSRRSGATGMYSQFSTKRDYMLSSHGLRRKRTVSSESFETASVRSSVSFANSVGRNLTSSSKNRASGSWDIPSGSRGTPRKHWDTSSTEELSKSQPVTGHFGGGGAEVDSAGHGYGEVESGLEWETGDDEDHIGGIEGDGSQGVDTQRDNEEKNLGRRFSL
ncbi:hypothetical protein HDU76_008205 [Blyttiomyces sp. JEL0837]|nr:hypothetical protein HDU76_008205 [Blyttiomyces sp. JEL0837]